MEKQTERERFRFDKPFVKGDIPPRTKNALWIQIDEEKRKIKDIKEYNSFGQWASIIEGSPGPVPPIPPVPPAPTEYKAGGILKNGTPTNDPDDSSKFMWIDLIFFSLNGDGAYKSDTSDYSLFPFGSPTKSKIIRECFASKDIYGFEDSFRYVINTIRQTNTEVVTSIIDSLYGEIVNAVTPSELNTVKQKLFSAIQAKLPELNQIYEDLMNNYASYHLLCLLPGILNIRKNYHIASTLFYSLWYPFSQNTYFVSGGVIEEALKLNPALESVLGPYDYCADGLNTTLSVNEPISYSDIVVLCGFTDSVAHLNIWDKEKEATLTESDSFGGMPYSRGYDITFFYNCKENYFITIITNHNS